MHARPHQAGERNPNAKLTADTIRRIRADLAAGHRQVDVAARYGISQSWVSWIKRRKAWTVTDQEVK